MDEQFYTSEEQCVLDIMANCDAKYRVALLASTFVLGAKWLFTDHPTNPRGVVISPDFDGPIRLYITSEMAW